LLLQGDGCELEDAGGRLLRGAVLHGALRDRRVGSVGRAGLCPQLWYHNDGHPGLVAAAIRRGPGSLQVRRGAQRRPWRLRLHRCNRRDRHHRHLVHGDGPYDGLLLRLSRGRLERGAGDEPAHGPGGELLDDLQLRRGRPVRAGRAHRCRRLPDRHRPRLGVGRARGQRRPQPAGAPRRRRAAAEPRSSKLRGQGHQLHSVDGGETFLLLLHRCRFPWVLRERRLPHRVLPRDARPRRPREFRGCLLPLLDRRRAHLLAL
ncbi:unnamed protein product, partial [Prorocentrum cordatum]